MYRIEVAPGAERDIRKLGQKTSRQDFESLRLAIDALSQNPRPGGVRKIKGAQKSYRVRVGSYRVVYSVYDDEELVVILQVGRRDEGTYR